LDAFFPVFDQLNLYDKLGMKPGVWYLCVNGLLTGLVYTVAGILVLFQPANWKKVVTGLLISVLHYTGLTGFVLPLHRMPGADYPFRWNFQPA
jgi:uncharacterized protein YjeT (DUF2065 family)